MQQLSRLLLMLNAFIYSISWGNGRNLCIPYRYRVSVRAQKRADDKRNEFYILFITWMENVPVTSISNWYIVSRFYGTCKQGNMQKSMFNVQDLL